MSRCVICTGRLWPWTSVLPFHGTASDLEIVPVHKPCGLAASAEFLRGLELSGFRIVDAEGAEPHG